MPTYQASRDARAMTLRLDPTGNVIGGGQEVMHDLLRSTVPSAQDAVHALGGGKARTSLAATIAQGSGGNPSSFARTFQRWEAWAAGQGSAGGKQTRAPSAKTVEKYQDAYITATGKRNPQLDDLLNALTGKVPSSLPKGDLSLEVTGDIEASSDPRHPENRGVRSVNIPIKAAFRLKQANAVNDPILAWLSDFPAAVQLQSVTNLTVVLRTP